MNKRSKPFLIARLLWPVVLVSFIGAQGRGQTPLSDGPNVNRGYPTQLSSFEQSSSLLPVLIDCSRNEIDRDVSKQFERAWRDSGNGITGREIVILIFRMLDGSYRAQAQGFTNQYKCCTFKWNPSAIAIVHTHPNCCDPKPGERDKLVADRYGVPNFTLTSTGMYEYDPATRRTNKLLNGLDWMNPTALRMASADSLFHEHFPSLGPLVGAVTNRSHIQIQ